METTKDIDTLIDVAVRAIDLPVEPAWTDVKAHLEVLLHLADAVGQFKLPDEAEPAPVFEA